MTSAAAPPARRVRRRPEVARSEIVDAAASVFASHGFGGARLDKIARAASMNVSLIYHYFENKEDLFVAVLEAAYARMRDEAFDFDDTSRSPVELMADFVSARFRIFLEQPELVGLLNAENVHRANHIERSERIRELYRPLVADLEGLLRRGARTGDFRADIDAADLFITINAVGYFYLSNRYTLSVVLGSNLTEPERIAQRERHIIDVVMSYLRPPPDRD